MTVISNQFILYIQYIMLSFVQLLYFCWMQNQINSNSNSNTLLGEYPPPPAPPPPGGGGAAARPSLGLARRLVAAPLDGWSRALDWNDVNAPMPSCSFRELSLPGH